LQSSQTTGRRGPDGSFSGMPGQPSQGRVDKAASVTKTHWDRAPLVETDPRLAG